MGQVKNWILRQSQKPKSNVGRPRKPKVLSDIESHDTESDDGKDTAGRKVSDQEDSVDTTPDDQVLQQLLRKRRDESFESSKTWIPLSHRICFDCLTSVLYGCLNMGVHETLQTLSGPVASLVWSHRLFFDCLTIALCGCLNMGVHETLRTLSGHVASLVWSHRLFFDCLTSARNG